MKKRPVLLQLYSVMEDLKKDFFGVIEKAKEMGYDGVEFPGYTGGASAAQISERVKALGLIGVSAHVNFDELCAAPDKTIEFYKTVGCKYIVIPWLDKSRLPGRDGFAATREKIMAMGERLAQVDMELLYHNHDFEFEKINGKYVFDELYDSIPTDVLKAELDVCWVRVGGAEPVEYIEKYADRLPIVHLKDFSAKGELSGERLFELLGGDNNGDTEETRKEIGFDFRPVGYGVQDFVSIMKAVQKSGADYVVVEQDKSTERPALEAAKMSIDYLRSIGC